jgi:hypothetical protein
MESSQCENLNHLFCRKVSFLTNPHRRFRGVGQGMKQTYLNYKKGCIRLAAGRHDIHVAEILLKVVLKHQKSNQN